MANDCVKENSRLIPLIKVVKAAILDQYTDIQSTQQLYLHFAGRGYKKLQREVLKQGGRKVMLTVNKNTQTATLPLDFENETFIGIINSRGSKQALKLNTDLADNCSYEEIESEDKCTSCNQDKTICQDLEVTESVELVVIGGDTYENKVIKKLYPNGDYYLETITYVPSLDGGTVSAKRSKEFITNLELKPCGCLETTTDNIEKIKTNCYDTYCCYYSGCDNQCSEGGYRIFPETGLIQFDFNFKYSKVYLEYTGFLPKKNGQYMIPEVAFETLVEWIKYKSVADKKSVSRFDKEYALNQYRRERGNMLKILGRVSLSSIIDASRRMPKFNIDYSNDWYSMFGCNNDLLNGSTGGSVSSNSSPSNTVVNNYPATIINNASYQLAVKTGSGTGHPVEGNSTYQNNILKGATSVNFLLLAKQTLVLLNDDFTFDSATGTIALLNGNTFFNGDTLVIPYNKTT